jgi:hypothetical protein
MAIGWVGQPAWVNDSLQELTFIIIMLPIKPLKN